MFDTAGGSGLVLDGEMHFDWFVAIAAAPEADTDEAHDRQHLPVYTAVAEPNPENGPHHDLDCSVGHVRHRLLYLMRIDPTGWISAASGTVKAPGSFQGTSDLVNCEGTEPQCKGAPCTYVGVTRTKFSDFQTSLGKYCLWI